MRKKGRNRKTSYNPQGVHVTARKQLTGVNPTICKELSIMLNIATILLKKCCSLWINLLKQAKFNRSVGFA
jgi:hypothetical protein